MQPDDLARFRFEAQALIERHRYDQARASISRALQLYPEDAELLYLAAFVDYAQDRNDQAFATASQLLATAPEHYGGRRLLAQLHENAQQFAEAEQQWLGLLRDYPADADLYGCYAQLMLQTLNGDKARRLALEGLRHEPSHAHCLFVLAMTDLIAARGGKFDTRTLQRLLSEHPEHHRTSAALLTALSERGDYAGALRIGQELLRARPDAPDVLAMVKDLKAQSHWSMLPLYPMQRWGWGGAAAVTFGGIVLLNVLRTRLDEPVYAALSLTWLAYVIYSWVWPSILKRII